MKRALLIVFSVFTLLGPAALPLLQGQSVPQPAPAAADTSSASANAAQSSATTTNAAAATQFGRESVKPPDFLEYLVDEILQRFDVRSGENTTSHFVISGSFLLAAILLRRVFTALLFRQLRRVASKTTTTLDDKLFVALEPPVSTFILLVGIFAALKVLKLPDDPDRYIGYASNVAFSLVIFWALLRAFSAVLDHAEEISRRRNLGMAAFMPWIKKTLITIFVAIGVLMIIQSLGYGESVKTVLAGLGLGGLAFALAAQDTLANVFGSIVVAIDQPFKIGEAVKIGSNEGTVEDIGLRSTKLRTLAKNLVIIPNKTVAAEPIINNSRFTRRRSEQVIGLTYDTSREQMEAFVANVRDILVADPEIDKISVLVYFRDLNASSLDIWVVFETPDPNFPKYMAVKQRVNLAIMRAVEERGLSFAFPTQTLHLATPSGGAPAVEGQSGVERRPSG